MIRFICMDKKGIAVATWSRKIFTVKSGESIDQNATGQFLFNGNVLAITTSQIDALKMKGRIVTKD